MDLREGRTLTPEQAKIFLNAVTGNRLEAAYVLALSLGLRRGEITASRGRTSSSWTTRLSSRSAVNSFAVERAFT